MGITINISLNKYFRITPLGICLASISMAGMHGMKIALLFSSTCTYAPKQKQKENGIEVIQFVDVRMRVLSVRIIHT